VIKNFNNFSSKNRILSIFPLDNWSILEKSRIIQQFTTDPKHVPIFIKHIPRQRKKGYYIFKIGSLYYSAHERLRNSSTIYLTCTTHKSRINVLKCTFKVSLKVLNIFDQAHPHFYHPNNFLVKPSLRQELHSCEGYESLTEAVQSLRI
jgi:hypothetical protein